MTRAFSMQLWADSAPGTVEHILHHQADLLPLLSEAVMEAERALLADHAEAAHMTFKPLVHARLWHLPGGKEFRKPNVSCIRSADVGRFISITGTVVRTAAVKMLESQREYQVRYAALRIAMMSMHVRCSAVSEVRTPLASFFGVGAEQRH
jgi:DNA replicative helicase MCM subunit Mcm2 (Cdc46/Mcm family)